MNSKWFIIVWLCVFNLFSYQPLATELDYYLPQSANYQSSVVKPQDILGYQVGEWHARPEQIMRYFQLLAEQSNRVKLEVIGYTHERRPLVLVYISSPENIQNLEAIRQQHLKAEVDQKTPIVTWMGYSVHGNEASGSNASLLFGYHLAAANDTQTLAYLDKQIIIIDPMLNPDGLARFAHWVNMYRSRTPNTNPLDIEHIEAWPKGRTNHYWFDLNRDWLLLQHPESRARVTQFHRWRPNVLTDFHEMGTDKSYFFQPGVKSRQNPLTSDSNFNMTARFAEYHAKALDKIGSLYFTKENYDDFYYGKGSTYPDIHGGIGILFEQGSVRGHAQESNHGTLTFPFAIRNHLTTSFSTLDAAQQNRLALQKMRADFNDKTYSRAKSDKNRAIVVSSQDPYRLSELQKILGGHQIEFYPLAKNIELNNKKYSTSDSLIIPLRQPQYHLILSLFEQRKKFSNNIFYDVSAWNIGLAFDVDFAWVSRSDFSEKLLGKPNELLNKKTISSSYLLSKEPEVIALAFDWSNFAVTRLLSRMHTKKLRVLGVTKPIILATQQGEQNLSSGSLVLPLKNQALSRTEIEDWLQPELIQHGIKAIEVTQGMALKGVDMGSPSLPVLKPVNPALLIGDGVKSYDAGEVWHFLDTRLSQKVTLVTQNQLQKMDKIDFTHLILVDGKYDFNKTTIAQLKHWVSSGGVIIAHSKGAKWLLAQDWASSHSKVFQKPVDTQLKYASKAQVDAKHIVGGAIANVKIDISNPLAFGVQNESLAVFKRGDLVFSEPREAFVAVARFTPNPLMAGYLSPEVQSHLANGTSVLVQGMGKGHLVAFSDNPLFRAFWLGTSRIFANALYYSPVIKSPEKTKKAKSEKSEVKKRKNEVDNT